MNKKITASLTVLLLTAAYHGLFWSEKMGINMILFSLLMIISSAFSRPGSWRNPMWWYCIVALTVTGISVIVFNTGIAKFTHGCAILMLIAYSCSTTLRSPALAIINCIAAYSNKVIDWVQVTVESVCGTRNGRKAWNIISLVFVPSLIIGVYILLYSGSSPAFARFFNNLVDVLVRMIDKVFYNFSISWMIFIVSGIVFISCIITGLPGNRIFNYLSEGSNQLFRKKKNRLKTSNESWTYISTPSFKMHSIRRQLESGVFLLVAVNILLLAYLITDIYQNWFGFTVPVVFNLKHFVHQATWYLIISILMSMAILLYYFKGNLNFYSKNKALKILAYAWIIQNTLLCISVLIRNMHYIQYHGLAYKRIGVLLFLVLTVAGLISFYIKINTFKSTSWLVKFNTVALFISLVIMSLVNWDMKILKYNLNHPNIADIDIDFYLRLSPQTYPVLLENIPLIEKQINAHQAKSTRWTRIKNIDEFKKSLHNRCKNFMETQSGYHWPSYNLPDARAYNELNRMKPELLTQADQ